MIKDFFTIKQRLEAITGTHVSFHVYEDTLQIIYERGNNFHTVEYKEHQHDIVIEDFEKSWQQR